MIRIPWFAWLLSLPLLAGCVPAEFDHPLSDPAAAAPDSSLLGAWMDDSNEGGPAMLFVTPMAGGRVQFVLAGPDTTALPCFVLRGFASRLGERHYLNLRPMASLRFAGSLIDDDARNRGARFAERWWIVRCDLSADGTLALSYFDDDKAKGLIDGAPLRGIPGRGDRVLRVTSETAELARGMPGLDQAFVALGNYRRVGTR